MSIFDEINITGRRRLPVMFSAEAAECGLVCMAMIARYHGQPIDLNGIRQRYALSLNGSTLRGLMALADRLGMGSRALKVELSEIGSLQTPAILHWDLNHFVVLRRVRRGHVVIHDPLYGVRTLPFSEVSKHLTGVALELFPEVSFARPLAPSRLKLTNLWTKAEGLWTAGLQILAMSLALQVATFAAPLLIQTVVDEAIGKSDQSLLAVLALGFGGIVLVQTCLDGIRSWSLVVFGNLVTFQMVGNVVRHLLRLPSDFFEKRSVGDILSRIGENGDTHLFRPLSSWRSAAAPRNRCVSPF